MFNLSPGQVSDVFRTRFGFHVAKLYDRQPPAIPPLKAIRGQIVDEVKEQKTRAGPRRLPRRPAKQGDRRRSVMCEV